MSTVFQGAIYDALKNTIDDIIDDDLDGYEKNVVMAKWMDEGSMEDAYVDDLEMGGPGILREKPEGEDIPMGTIREGALTRYVAKTFALGIAVTQEAMEDCKYSEVISAARRLKRALWKTVDYDSTNVLIRMFNTSYVGGDGQPLCSNAHPLPNGGTMSNIMATPMAPSVQAVAIATTQIRKFPGHDGLFDMYMPKKILCPVDQWEAWAVITGSSKRPEAGEFNAINVVNQDLKLTVVPNVFWSSTSTNWALKTDVEKGLVWKWRVRPKSASWVNNEQTLMKYSIRARWARLWSDPRGILGVNA